MNFISKCFYNLGISMMFFSKKVRNPSGNLDDLEPEDNISEVSIGTENEHLPLLFESISTLFDEGLKEDGIDTIINKIQSLSYDEEEEFILDIVFNSKPSVLRINVFMDGLECPAITFYSNKDLVGEIEKLIIKFVDEVERELEDLS